MVAFPELPTSMEGITETNMRVGVAAEVGEMAIHGGAALPAVPASMVVVYVTAPALLDTMEIACGSGMSPPVKNVKLSDSGETCNSGKPAENVTVYCWLAVKPRLSVTCTV